MCTVTFLPTLAGPVITSSRDEKYLRPFALPPKTVTHSNLQIMYPVDGLAGGTWIAARNDGQVCVLLNGAFANHTSTGNYAKSRGNMLKEMMLHPNLQTYLQQVPLHNMEPFTLVAFTNGYLHEYRWDGTDLFTKQLNEHKPHIWSSATLYTAGAVEKRRGWFTHWFAKKEMTTENIWQFHQWGGEGDDHDKICMNRINETRTVSITMVQLANQQVTMRYFDVPNNQAALQKMPFVLMQQTS